MTGSFPSTSGKLEIVVIALCEYWYRPAILGESVADVAGRAPRQVQWGERNQGSFRRYFVHSPEMHRRSVHPVEAPQPMGCVMVIR